MKLSIIVITANPLEKQYAYFEALQSYADLADEVIIIDGGTEKIQLPKWNMKLIHIPDPPIWNWAEHAKRLNRGLDESDSDWTIKVDIDWIFHEEDFKFIREKLSFFDTPVATFQKKTVYPKMRYIQKGEIPIAIYKKDKKNIRFGKDVKKYTDLTYPIWWNGQVDESGVPLGSLVQQKDWGKTGADFWNFDYTFSTIEKMKKKWLRMSESHKAYFGTTSWGLTEDESLEKFLRNMQGKFHRSIPIESIERLPKYIRKRMENLTPTEFGKNGWNML